MSRTQLAWSAVVGLVLVLAGALGANLRGHPGHMEATFRMAATTSGPGQVFIQEAGEYTEAASVRFDPIGDGRMHDYAVLLVLRHPLRAMRLDPGTSKGTLTIRSVAFSWRGYDITLEDDALRQAIRPLKQLEMLPGGEGVSFRSTGGDPFLAISVPAALTERMARRMHAGTGLLLMALVGISVLCWRTRHVIRAGVRRAAARGHWSLFSLVVVLALAVLAATGRGCDGLCSPRGIGFGTLLLLAALAMAAMGRGLLRALRVDPADGRPRLFLSLVSGQALLVVYIAVRSLIHARIPALPVTAAELLVLAGAAGAWAAQDLFRISSGRRWLLLELALLAVVCMVIGDRELPRLVMLSSDPDTHAYFARLFEIKGGVPWWGGDATHYPMGTGALGLAWAQLSFLDVRNAVTALPLMQAFLAALLLAEGFALRVHGVRLVLLLFLAALALTAAAFLLPLYANYAHMEGAGRQMAIATLALVPAVLVSRRSGNGLAVATLMLLSLFLLAVLNPINVVVPMILLAGYGLHRLTVRRRVELWILVPFALLVMLLLDPYYFALITGRGTPDSRFTVDAALAAKPASLVLAQWSAGLARGPLEFLVGNARFLPAQAPWFAPVAVALLAVLWWLRRWSLRSVARATVVILLMLASLWAADALFDVLLDDRRFYLLAPYYWLALGQLKILLVTGLVLATLVAGHLRGVREGMLLAFAALAVATIGWALHSTQPMMDRSRVDYCGSLGCIEPDDISTLRGFEALARAGKLSPGRVLLPNSRHEAHREQWIFPVTAARALPFFDVPAPAFYYYQGDPDFTTENYVRHVCSRFDESWLSEQGVAYVFLPARRDSACLAGMETLVQSRRVIVRHGNSMILELR